MSLGVLKVNVLSHSYLKAFRALHSSIALCGPAWVTWLPSWPIGPPSSTVGVSRASSSGRKFVRHVFTQNGHRRSSAFTSSGPGWDERPRTWRPALHIVDLPEGECAGSGLLVQRRYPSPPTSHPDLCELPVFQDKFVSITAIGTVDAICKSFSLELTAGAPPRPVFAPAFNSAMLFQDPSTPSLYSPVFAPQLQSG
jgi:hypothetical protein